MVEALLIFVAVVLVLLGVTGAVTLVIEKAPEFHFTTFKPCCPPGLGCNDPDPKRRQCRRSIVFRIAEFDDGQAVDQRWQEFNETSRLRPIKRRSTLKSYARTRDSVFDREFAQAAHALLERQPSRQQLPSGSEVANQLGDPSDIKQAHWEVVD